MPSTAWPSIWPSRNFISRAALLVKVTERISPGRARPWLRIWAIRQVSTRVLPVPAPASTSTGPSSVSTASRCSGLRPARYCGVAAALAVAGISNSAWQVGGAYHAKFGSNVSDHCVDRGHFGLRRGCRLLDRNGEDHLIHRGRAVPGLSCGRFGARPYPGLALRLIVD